MAGRLIFSRHASPGTALIVSPATGQTQNHFLESMGVHKAIRGIGYAAIINKVLRVTRSIPSDV